MKKIYILLALFISAISFGQTSDLYFSMYAEGSSNNKFLEIYNGTGATVNLDNYAFPNVSNAPSVPGEYEFWNTFPAGAMLADGDVFVIAHGSADATILAQADMTFNFLSNGDDGFALVANDGTWTDSNSDGDVDAGEMTGYTVLDWLGDFQADPGSGWTVAGITNATQNHTLTRKTSVCGPNNDWAASAGTDAATSEWIVGANDSGWNDLGSYTGCQSAPALSIGAPADMMEFPSGTTNVDVSIAVQNFVVDQTTGSGDGHIHWTVNGAAQPMKYDVADESITTTDGETYVVVMTLVDNSHMPITPTVSATVTFSVAFPCELILGAEDAICDAETSGVDTYTATIAFTGGGTSTYTIDTAGIGIVGGDNPSSMANGTIMISNITEGTNITVTITGDSANSSCNLNTTINSPVCIGSITCPNVGDVIVTEIMKNPNAVGDNNGEYFEVYNTTSNPIDMQGWDITDDGSDTHTIAATLVVPAMGYAVLGINNNAATNGNVSVDYQYNSYSLSNSADEINLVCSGTTIDAVAYDGTFPNTAGAAMELSPTALDATSNDAATNWSDATTDLGNGDFGTPGSTNGTSSTKGFNKTSFSIYPNPTNTGFVNIKTTSNEAVSVSVFDILGKQVVKTTLNNNTLDVSNLRTGVYIIKLSQNGNTTTKKLVIN